MSQPSNHQNTTPSPFGRKIKLLAFFMGTLVALVVVGWFIAAHFYSRALDEGRQALAGDGVQIACASEDLAGFPARFEFACNAMTITLANGTTLTGGNLGTVAPLWNPLFTIVEWQGPFRAVNGRDFDAEIRSDLLRASIRLSTGLELQRLSAVLNPLEIVLQGAPQAVASATGAEVHVRQPPEGTGNAGDLEVAALLLGVESLFLAADQTDLSVTALAEQLGTIRATSAREALRLWVARSGQISPLAMRLRLDDHAVNLEGDLGLDSVGVLDFDGTVATNDVAALATLMGAGDSANAISAGAMLLGQQVQIGDDTATQLPLRVDQGAVSIGPVPLGELAPLQF